MPEQLNRADRKQIEDFRRLDRDCILPQVVVDSNRCIGCGLCVNACPGSSLELYITDPPPCTVNCQAGSQIREWIGVIAERDNHCKSEDQALTEAWDILVNNNPFPAVMGRVCPNLCELHCSREVKDQAVSVNAMERFIGDWGLKKKLRLPRLENHHKTESIGVIGAGPAGLSFAYQMARRSYPVTIYEASDKAGGMLYWGVPPYRQRSDVLEAEINRILDLGVELKLNTKVGKDISIDSLKSKHQVIFVGIGAQKGKKLGIPAEDGSDVWIGIDFLRQVKRGELPNIGKRIGIIGGGDTAIDSARVARRLGSEVTIFYRRSRAEMPAISSEIDAALKEGIEIEFLTAPFEIQREGDRLKYVIMQKMDLAEPDVSGRLRPIPIQDSHYRIALDSLIIAVAQTPDWEALENLFPKNDKIEADRFGKVDDGIWIGGDALNIDLAVSAIGQGKSAAEAAHAELRSLPPPEQNAATSIDKQKLAKEAFEDIERVQRSQRPVETWLSEPNQEIDQGITKDQLLTEVERCFACGKRARMSGEALTCMSCGDCVAICPKEAIEVRQFLQFRRAFRYLDRGEPQKPRKF